jgi:hypothetical protein
MSANPNERDAQADAERIRMRAIAEVEDLELAADLNNLEECLNRRLIAPDALEVNAVDKEELCKLIKAIKEGTAKNEQCAKFLGIWARICGARK